MARDDTDTAITLLDDATRPKAPKIEGITPAQRRQGKRLALIHEYHLEQMNEVRWVMEQVEAGEQSTETLLEAISSLQMAANYRVFGNLCGRECQMLTLHHTIEDQSIFPELRQGSDGLRKVVDRLAQEHLIIHQLLEALHDKAVNAVREPGRETFAALKAAFLALDRVVRSHFGYEQEELEEALGYFGIPL
jgi:iron-sulfur cluster repair protein YtfE (RIC family)